MTPARSVLALALALALGAPASARTTGLKVPGSTQLPGAGDPPPAEPDGEAGEGEAGENPDDDAAWAAQQADWAARSAALEQAIQDLLALEVPDDAPGPAAPGVGDAAEAVLAGWAGSHLQHPFPDAGQMAALAAQTGLSPNQVDQWMIQWRFEMWEGPPEPGEEPEAAPADLNRGE